MFEVGVYEAKAHLAEIIRRVEAGEECIITRRGKKAVRMINMQPPSKKKNPWDELRKLGKSINAKVTVDEIISWKHEGHKW